MVPTKSLDSCLAILRTLLLDVQDAHGEVFTSRACRLTYGKVVRRALAEGMGFLTKTLPRLGKAFDKAISGGAPLDASVLGFATKPGSQLPRFLGELFERVLQPNGVLLERPCAQCVRTIRQVLYLFYKYELPYSDEQEQQVVQSFQKAEEDLSTLHPVFQTLERHVADRATNRRRTPFEDASTVNIAREARILLAQLLANFDPLDIHPRHGPGAVATKQRLWSKYLWTNVASRITDVYPFDAYFMASMGHVCDRVDAIGQVTQLDLPARVILVPKDSRGPRLISEEPVDFQWIQQGLGKAIVEYVESGRHPEQGFSVRGLAADSIHFTCQALNRIAALHGSATGKYVTLDLKEASDRVSLDLVRLLFPEHLYRYLEACRSSSTVLPDGGILTLNKYAPMGSCLCFPILALTIWAILAAGAPDADTRDSILVYGDDVIVPKHYAPNAISYLESFGLSVNRDKSCMGGLFRESCGMDAFQGVEVTPVRLRTVWHASPSPDVYSSWIAYANSMFDRRYFRVYEKIVEMLHSIYGAIPSDDMHLACPSLRSTSEAMRPKRRRVNKSLQKLEYYVRTLTSPVIRKSIDGWSMLLRFFAEAGTDSPLGPPTEPWSNAACSLNCENARFSVSEYTDRRSAKLVWRWISVR